MKKIEKKKKKRRKGQDFFKKMKKKQKLKKRYCVIFGVGKEDNNFNSKSEEILKILK
jgi:hypothetical protein